MGIAGKVRGFLGRKAVKVIVIAAIVILVLAGSLLAFTRAKGLLGDKAAVQQRTAFVQKGSMRVSITGSGPINSSNESQVTSAVTGKITKIYFDEGDEVKAGDLLLELDDSDAKLNVEKIRNSIAQTRLSASSSQKSVSSLRITAPYAGQITDMVALKVGDEVNKGATVLTITDTSRLKLKISFSGAIIGDVTVGKKVTVNIQDLMQSVEGSIAYVSSKPLTTGTGGAVYDAEVIMENPGSLKAGLSANVEVDTKNGSQSSLDAGKLEYVDSQVMKSLSGGTVSSINVKENQRVKAGDTLIQLKNEDLEVSTQTDDLKLLDLQNQLDTAEKQLSEYRIYAPSDGIIVSQSLKVGNSVKPADVLMTITDPAHMEFEVSVDELDIGKINIEQKADITLDALEETTERPLSGQVSKIAIQGSSSNGVTTYPVTIQINEAGNLKVGMNANAEISINEKSDILMVPLEAIQKAGGKNVVMVKGQQPQNQSQKNGSGFEARPVQVGINNDQYIEITSGLQEGEEILLPALSSGSTTTQAQPQMGGGMMGAMGGSGAGGFGGGAGEPPQGGNSRRN